MGGYNFQGIHSFLLEVDIFLAAKPLDEFQVNLYLWSIATQIYILSKRLTIYGKNLKYFSAHKICNQKNQNEGFI